MNIFHFTYSKRPVLNNYILVRARQTAGSKLNEEKSLIKVYDSGAFDETWRAIVMSVIGRGGNGESDGTKFVAEKNGRFPKKPASNTDLSTVNSTIHGVIELRTWDWLL